MLNDSISLHKISEVVLITDFCAANVHIWPIHTLCSVRTTLPCFYSLTAIPQLWHCSFHEAFQSSVTDVNMSSRFLPMELYSQIFEHFQLTTRDIATTDVTVKGRDVFIKLERLCSICLVSNDLHRIAWPILYRVFPFTSDSLGYMNYVTNDGGTKDVLYL